MPHTPLNHHSKLPPIEWAERVNRSWFVHGELKEHAKSWIEYLRKLEDGRLLKCCKAAKTMSRIRTPLEDPKPWFYAGLFSQATADEARWFLSQHRVTRATVPAMADDAEVALWLDRAGPETRDVMARIRQALADMRD